MSKLTKKLGILTLAAVPLILTSCGDDTIYPDLSDEITVSDNSFLTKDDLVYIYEKLHDESSTGSEVRDLILRKYAQSFIGDFELTEAGEIVLNGYDDKTTDSDKLAYVKNHEVYWSKEETSTGSNIYEAKEPTELTDEIKTRIENVKALVKEKVVETIFDEANTSTYKVNNYFYEYKFARAKFETSKITGFAEDLSDPDNVVNIYDKKWEADYVKGSTASDFPFTNGILIDNSIGKDDIDSIIGTSNNTGVCMLHLGLYADYINREVIPTIMDTLLVEQYILDRQYTTLSRTQARHVNYISISTDTSNVNSARRLIEAFVNSYISGNNEDSSINFSVLQDAWIGNVFDLDTNESINADAIELLEKANFELIENHNQTNENLYDGSVNTTYIDGKQYTFYKDTKYGDLMENYAKINKNAKDSDSNTQKSTFTNSGAYSYEKGLKIQYDTLKTNDYIVFDWGTSDSGLSDLPSAIKTNLFKYNVSVDTPTNKDNFTQSDYVVKEGSHYFLKKQDAQSGQLIDSIVLRDSSTFYIVEITDAISQSKLALNSDSYSVSDREAIARDIGYTLASNDTYTSSAYLYYLEQLDIQYHDQSIYDYMLDAYPDLFE